MTNSTDVSDMKMTRFGYRVDLMREGHVRVKDEAKIATVYSIHTQWRRLDVRLDWYPMYYPEGIEARVCAVDRAP